jgi:hypothetical protein
MLSYFDSSILLSILLNEQRQDEAYSLDLFKNPVGSRTSPAKCSTFCYFQAEVVQKLKFLNNSIMEKFRSQSQFNFIKNRNDCHVKKDL